MCICECRLRHVMCMNVTYVCIYVRKVVCDACMTHLHVAVNDPESREIVRSQQRTRGNDRFIPLK